jgi:hypothetical protein
VVIRMGSLLLLFVALMLGAPGVGLAQQTFQDVPPSNPFFPFIEELVDLGITTGCIVTPPLYCPNDPVTRAQMAAFIIKALDTVPTGSAGPPGPPGPTGPPGPPQVVSPHTVPAFSFSEFELTNDNTSQAYNSDINTGARFCTLINCRLLAPVQLPAGALVSHIEVDGCDTNADSNFSVVLRRSQAHEGGTTQLASADSAGTPGCVFVTGNLATPETIDNRNNTYFLDYIDGGTNDGSLRFTAVRIFYTLQ